MPDLPSGTVTFLFTDIEGSTRLLHELGDEYADALADHRRVLRDAFERHGGVEVDTQGDAFFVAFERASDAVASAREGQEILASGPVRVRMGLHTGEPLVTEEGYVGVDVHRAARIAAAGHGGQILISQSTRDLGGFDGLRDLGEHRLKDLVAPERIYQLGEEEFPPLKSLNVMNLPLSAEPLLGRKKELVDVLRLVREERARVVTVTGPGGIGKTRFALESAAELRDDFSDGVWFVALASLRDPELVVPTIAATIEAKSDLRDHLADRKLLLLLDNFEQIVGAAADLADVLAVCPGLVVLVTSREPLHIAGEREYQLHPLAESPGVELFRQRAAAVVANFDSDYAELAEICHRLDSLPLAIELAAARVKLLPPTTLLARLDTRLPLLMSRRRDTDERHRTLSATIEWSYDLLVEDERSLFARLAVFPGSFGAAAAEQVCDADLDTLESLLEKSLLRQTSDGRFFMLETIREFAGELLRDSSEALTTGRQHAHYFYELSSEIRPIWEADKHQGASLTNLESEIHNFRSALEFLGGNDPDRELELAAALSELFRLRFSPQEGRAWLEAALSHAPSSHPSRMDAVEKVAYFAYQCRDLTAAEKWVKELRDTARERGDDLTLGKAFHLAGTVALAGGNAAEATRLVKESVPLLGEDPYAPFAHQALAYLAILGDDTVAGVGHARRSIELGGSSHEHAAGGLALIATARILDGDTAGALRCARENLLHERELGLTPYFAQQSLPIVASLAATCGDFVAAARLLAAAESLLETSGGQLGPLFQRLHDSTMTTLKSRLDDEALSAEWRLGYKLIATQAYELALMSTTQAL